MNAPSPRTPAQNTDHLVPAPASRLGPALDWLGHSCPRRCAEPIADLPASAWFIRPKPMQRTGLRGKVVVEVAGPPEVAARIRDAIKTVNDCATADGIQVFGRRRNRGSRALTLLDPGSP